MVKILRAPMGEVMTAKSNDPRPLDQPANPLLEALL